MNTKYLLGILVLMLVISPALAQTYSFTAPAQKAVWAIDVNAPWGSSGTITMHQSNGDTTIAQWSYTGFPATANTQIGSDTSSFTYIVPTNLQMQVWNGDNVSLARQLKLGAGEVKGVWNTISETSIAAYPITSYTVSSDKTVVVSQEVVTYSKAMQDLNPEDSDAVGYVLSLVWAFVGFIKVLFYWIGFFFVTGIVMITALYIAITGAMSFGTTKNIFTALRKFFKYQRAYVEFIIYLWGTLIQIASYVRGLFKFI
jgi:hypothetical protein